jgi:hypothetical protein
MPRKRKLKQKPESSRKTVRETIPIEIKDRHVGRPLVEQFIGTLDRPEVKERFGVIKRAYMFCRSYTRDAFKRASETERPKIELLVPDKNRDDDAHD